MKEFTYNIQLMVEHPGQPLITLTQLLEIILHGHNIASPYLLLHKLLTLFLVGTKVEVVEINMTTGELTM